MKLNDTSAKSLLWLAAIILFTGMMTASPAGRFFAACGAGLCAFAPLCAGPTRKRRIIAGIVVLAATLFAYSTFDEYQKGDREYRERAQPAQSLAPPATPLPDKRQ